MRVTYVFNFSLSPLDLTIVSLLAGFITGAGCSFAIIENA